jgi:hypothetical protein
VRTRPTWSGPRRRIAGVRRPRDGPHLGRSNLADRALGEHVGVPGGRLLGVDHRVLADHLERVRRAVQAAHEAVDDERVEAVEDLGAVERADLVLAELDRLRDHPVAELRVAPVLEQDLRGRVAERLRERARRVPLHEVPLAGAVDLGPLAGRCEAPEDRLALAGERARRHGADAVLRRSQVACHAHAVSCSGLRATACNVSWLCVQRISTRSTSNPAASRSARRIALVNALLVELALVGLEAEDHRLGPAAVGPGEPVLGDVVEVGDADDRPARGA